MKKIIINLFCCIILALSFVFIGGCDKRVDNSITNKKSQLQTVKANNSVTDDKDKSIAKRVEINELKNERLKEVIEDKKETLKNGIYGCISKDEGNYYIFINGVDYWYSNISFSIKDKVLTVRYDTKYEEGLGIKQLFLINPDNARVFDKVELINNGNKENLKYYTSSKNMYVTNSEGESMKRIKEKSDCNRLS